MANRFDRSKLSFLFPLAVVREKRFSKKDVNYVKNGINSGFSFVRLIIAIFFFVMSLSLMISMRNATGGKQAEVYGYASIVSQIVSMAASAITIVLLVSSFFIKNDKVTNILKRIASYTLFIGISLQMLLGIYADAKMGFTTQQETVSASIILTTILLIIQPAFWTDGLIMDVGFTVGYISLCLYCTENYNMKALHYYILVGVIYPICCYFIITLLFYAESQHYKDMMENSRLNDKAYYDSLTKCKNRHALTEFVKENAKNWKNQNLLIILFDIDNFKQYNDQFSHLGGDYCLKSIADAVRSEFASPSLDFFRYGGEEFLLFFELDDKLEAPLVMEKIRKAIRNQEIAAPQGAPKDVVTVSLGGILIERVESFKFEDELALVDKYLYIAKASGKDVSCFNGELIDN